MKFNFKTTALLAATLLFASQAFATYNPQNPNGSATSANSSPVVIASDQAALPLPTGAATSAAQTTGNNSLATVATNTGNIPAKGQATMANSTPVAIASNQTNLPANVAQVGGASVALGSTTGSASIPVVIASDQASVQTNLTKIGGTTLAFGQANSSASIPVTLAAPNVSTASTFIRPNNATAYAVGNIVANNTAGASVTPLSWAMAPANGVPVYLTSAIVAYQTSGGAGVATTAAWFRIHFFNTSPTTTNGDGGAFTSVVTLANWCGIMDVQLIYQGSDWTVGVAYPVGAPYVACKPAGGSSTIYGLMEAKATFTPTALGVFSVQPIAQ